MTSKCTFYAGLAITTAWKVSVFELFWPVFSHTQTEYGEILRISPYSVRMRENKDQKNSEYGRFSRSELQNFSWNRYNFNLFEYQGIVCTTAL